MQPNTEGMLIAGYCLMVSFLSGAQAKGIFNNSEITQIYNSASLFLARINPALMSPEARAFANEQLEELAKKFGPAPN